MKFSEKLIFLLLYPFLRKSIKLKNSHKGEKVYLVGDSAEIKFFDFKNFDDAPAIFFNKSILFGNNLHRRSKSYALTVEPYYFFRMFKKKRLDSRFIKYYFKKIYYNNIIFIHSASNLFLLPLKRFIPIYKKLPKCEFTRELLENNNRFNAGAFQAAFSFAIYMGFKEIVIIGVSYHSKSVQNHWIYEGLGKVDINEFERGLNTSERNSFINFAKKYVDKISLITYKESSSIYFETITYQDYTGEKIIYRENHQLIDEYLLKISQGIYPM